MFIAQSAQFLARQGAFSPRSDCRRVAPQCLLALGAVLVLASCATEPGGIFRTADLTKDESVLVGARKRAILNNPVDEGSRPGLINPKRVVCAEPSPDVALAIAQSAGVGLSVLWGGTQGSGTATGATTEGIAQLGERTQAIQLLRDQMYRACEAYANGAITGTTYNLIMSKNNDAMVTLMVAGVAAGEFGRAGAAIGGSARSEARAHVSNLLDTLQAADEADNELKDSEKKEEAAEEKVEDKKKADASTEEVVEAENELAAAREDVRKKLEKRNEADSKARAEITKVVGAGSITSRSSVGVAQALERMQDNYLREDFSDEYVAACIVEMGLADAGAPLFLNKRSEYEDIGRHWVIDDLTKIKDLKDFEKAGVRGEAFIRFMNDSRKAERYSLFAQHCRDNLLDFVVFANTGDREVERDKLRLDAQRIAMQGDATRKETLELYGKLLSDCKSIEDPKARQHCQESISTIVKRPGGVFELGPVTTVEVPTGKSPSLVVTYKRTKQEIDEQVPTTFAAQKEELSKASVPMVDAAKLTEADAEALKKRQKELSEDHADLKRQAENLQEEFDEKLADEQESTLAERQTARRELADELELMSESNPQARTIAMTRLKLHDLESERTIREYETLEGRLEEATNAIEDHLTELEVLKIDIAAAEQKKAGSA